MTTRKEQAIERKSQIKEVALGLFIRTSIDGTTIKDISKAAKISGGLLFHYYNNKDEIYHELLEEGIEAVSKLLVPDKGISTPLAIYENCTAKTLDYISNERNAKLFILVYNAVQNNKKATKKNPKLNEFITKINGLTSLITLGQQLNEFVPGDNKVLMSLYLSLLYGSATHFIHDGVDVPRPIQILRIIKKV